MSLSPATQQLSRDAFELAREHRWPEAMSACRRLIEETHHPDVVYDDWVRILADATLRTGKAAMAGVCFEYLLDFERACQAYEQARRFVAAARCRLRAGDRIGAAKAFETIGAQARAAVAWEQAGDLPRAIRCWERAAQHFGARERNYEMALCLLNLGLAQLDAGDKQGRATLSRAIVHIEEEADRAETRGEIPRALACYHALIHLGRQTATHENLAEGFLNCVRLMQRRDHRFFVLQYYHDFAEASLLVGENQAAAEVLREAGEFCRRTGMLYANDFLARAAAAFEEAAEQQLQAGVTPELAENALLAALDCHNRRGDLARVQATYARLAELPLSQARCRRYHELAQKVEVPASASPEGWRFRGYYSGEAAYPPTWRTDVVAAEVDADLLAPIAEAMGDLKYWDVVRRRCLILCLRDADPAEDRSDPTYRMDLVAELGKLGAPIALGPLRRIFEDPSSPASLRAAVAAVLRFLPFREAVELCGEAFRDPDESVREAALGGLRYLVFPGAFVPLMRLYREHDDLEVRRQVVLALGRLVGMEHPVSKDALDFLLHTWREGAEPLLEDDLRIAVAANVTPATLPTLERHLLAEPE
ncbi:MAG: HEAT repeat domain-containing protein, partial [Deltaproteobacteria bacterium]